MAKIEDFTGDAAEFIVKKIIAPGVTIGTLAIIGYLGINALLNNTKPEDSNPTPTVPALTEPLPTNVSTKTIEPQLNSLNLTPEPKSKQPDNQQCIYIGEEFPNAFRAFLALGQIQIEFHNEKGPDQTNEVKIVDRQNLPRIVNNGDHFCSTNKP